MLAPGGGTAPGATAGGESHWQNILSLLLGAAEGTEEDGTGHRVLTCRHSELSQSITEKPQKVQRHPGGWESATSLPASALHCGLQGPVTSPQYLLQPL